MTYATLEALQRANANETRAFAARHFFVQLENGRWTRTLDAPPKNARHVRGRIYTMKGNER